MNKVIIIIIMIIIIIIIIIIIMDKICSVSHRILSDYGGWTSDPIK